MALKKIGLLGGSFDPIHRGHIALALSALEHIGLDEVQLIPAADPWQKEPLKASAVDRLNMAKLAAHQHPGLRVNPSEINRGGKTYTIETLENLPRDAQYFWILGSDQLSNFCTWHRWEDILIHVHLVVAARPGRPIEHPGPLTYVLDILKKPLIELPFEPVDIASTQLRAALHTGRPVDNALDADVLDYIKTHHLYQP